MAKIIWNGQPGTYWYNDTGHVLYQLIPAFVNTCGVCLQFTYAISGPWPIPLHKHCRCRQVAIAPG